MAITYFKKDGRTHQTVHNHTYEPNLITESGWALDLGCNDFIISRHLLSLGLRVIGIDPINNLSIPITQFQICLSANTDLLRL